MTAHTFVMHVVMGMVRIMASTRAQPYILQQRLLLCFLLAGAFSNVSQGSRAIPKPQLSLNWESAARKILDTQISSQAGHTKLPKGWKYTDKMTVGPPSTCGSSSNPFISNNHQTREFLLTSIGTSGSRHRWWRTWLMLQLLRYCSPHILEWSPERLSAMGIDTWWEGVNRTHLSDSPRSCNLHFIVDNTTLPIIAHELLSFAVSLPHEVSEAATQLRRKLLRDEPPHDDSHVDQHAASHHHDAHADQQGRGSASLLGKLDAQHLARLRKRLLHGEQHKSLLHDVLLVVQHHLHIGVHFHEPTEILGDSANADVLKCMNWPNVGQLPSNIKAWMARVFAFKLLPNTVHHVLSLDTDVLILGNLDELFCALEDFAPDQVLGLAFEQNPGYRKEWSFDSFRALCPSCNLGIWRDAFPGFNGGVTLMHLEHMRTSAKFQSVLNNTDGMCDRFKSSIDNRPMYSGDQDLYVVLATMFPELFYILPCEWNYQLYDGSRWAAPEGLERCESKPKMYHADGRSSFPMSDLGVYWWWGNLTLKWDLHRSDITPGSPQAVSLVPSEPGGPTLNLTAVIHGRCSCLKPYV